MHEEQWREGPSLPYERPCAELQIYRQTDRLTSGWKFESTFSAEDGAIDPEELKTGEPLYLLGLCPFEFTRSEFGGGDYEFRFRWRDESGEVKCRKSLRVAIEGESLPRPLDRPLAEEAPEAARSEAMLEKGWAASRGAASDRALLLALVQEVGELQLEVVRLRTQVRSTSRLEDATAILKGLAPLVESILAQHAQSTPARKTRSSADRSTDQVSVPTEAITHAPRYRRRARAPRLPRQRAIPGARQVAET